MTPAEFHFITGLTEGAKHMTLRNATANATFDTIMSADISELKMPTFWIQLGLIPVPGIIACYIVGKVVDYLRGPPRADRQLRLVTDSVIDLGKQHTGRSTGQEEEDDGLANVRFQRKRDPRQREKALNDLGVFLPQPTTRSYQPKEEDDDSDVIIPHRKTRSYQHKEENEEPIGAQSQRTRRFRQQIDRIHQSADHLREKSVQSLRRPQPVTGSVRPRGTVESGHLAGADAKDRMVIGKEHTQSAVDGDHLRALDLILENDGSEYDLMKMEDDE
ncbi:hypothetical protein G7Y79_00041g077830 [Physcia stellaris]|nr:hypothetical protein G7Y79_00041g077830 [Physcia stellaris]